MGSYDPVGKAGPQLILSCSEGSSAGCDARCNGLSNEANVSLVTGRRCQARIEGEQRGVKRFG